MTEARLHRGFRPTASALRLLFAITALNLLGLAAHPLLPLSAALDLAWLVALLIDARRVHGIQLRAQRTLPEVALAFTANRVAVTLANPMDRALRGRWLDTPPEMVETREERQSFELAPLARLETSYELCSPPRGLLAFGDLHVELEGPWGLANCRATVPSAATVRCLPTLADGDPSDLRALAQREPGRVRLRRLMEGREFDALREFRSGDDHRLIDWKATARRGEPIVREYAPERNQAVVLLLDCGRHLVARERGRAKLDYSLQAALRLARACLERGDAVGLLAFGASVRAWVAPTRGGGQLKALIDATFDLQPVLEESDYRAAFDTLQQRVTRRALICVFSEIGDEDSSRVLLARAAALRPKHLPVLITLDDAELGRVIRETPIDTAAAYARAAAVRLERERGKACRRMRSGGVTLVRAPAERLSLASIDAYLGIKARGLL